MKKKKKNSVTSLYVHIPFCDEICDYCDFTKVKYYDSLAKEYINNLEKELKNVIKNKALKTIYVGGGTPTSLNDGLFLRLLEMLDPYIEVVEEYTFEANPESLSLNKLKMMKGHGVNRISLGVESTDDKILKAINRHHTFLDVVRAVKNARKIGFNNINIDLILGLPNVSENMLKKDLDNVLSLNPEHISTYSLTVHPNTMFFINKIAEPEDDYAYSLYKLVHETLLKEGYVHYEVSNFAKNGYQSKHNFVYWKNEEYYGVGLSASGYVDGVRYKNTDSITKYNLGETVFEKEVVNDNDYHEYFIMLNLRTNEGIDLKQYINIFNKDLYISKRVEIDEFIKENYLYIKDDHLIPTFDGMMILDQIILKLI